MTEHEKQVLQRLKQGDEPVWIAFMNAAQPRLEQIFRHFVNDEEKVQDMLGTTLVTIVSAIGKIPLEDAHGSAD